MYITLELEFSIEELFLFFQTLTVNLCYRCYSVEHLSKLTCSHASQLKSVGLMIKKSKPTFYYSRGITPERITSGGAYLRSLTQGKHRIVPAVTSRW